jgi:hypothetical protein
VHPLRLGALLTTADGIGGPRVVIHFRAALLSLRAVGSGRAYNRSPARLIGDSIRCRASKMRNPDIAGDQGGYQRG